MKVTLCLLLVGLTVTQGNYIDLINCYSRRVLIGKERLHPKRTLQEWQDLLEKAKYVPPSPHVRGVFPQPASSGINLTPRIIGGARASSGQFPWQVSVVIDGQTFCGGSLISQDWILTAGHCVYDARTWTIRAGSLRPQSGGQSTTSRNGILHEGYDPIFLENDIGVVAISGISIGSATVNSVLLPSRNIGDLVGETARVSGWGLESDSSSSIASALNFVDLTIANVSVCLNYFGGISTEIICIDTSNGKSSCNGDSGGPLVIQGSDGRWTEVGIVSFGSTEGCEIGAPAGFTRVTTHLDWISRTTGLRV